MATYLTDVKCGDKKYHISHNGEDLYYNSSSKTGGSTIKKLKFRNNQIIYDGKVANEFQICQAINASK